MSVFDPNGAIFCHFSNAAAASGCCSRNRVNSSDSSPGLGKYRSRASRLSISRSTRYLPSRVPRSPFRRWVFHPGRVNDDAISSAKTRSYSSGSTPGCSSISCRPNTFGMANPLHSRQITCVKCCWLPPDRLQEGSKGGNSRSRSARQSSSHAHTVPPTTHPAPADGSMLLWFGKWVRGTVLDDQGG